MCILCLRPSFYDYDLAPSEKEKLRAKAQRVKQEVRMHEDEVNAALMRGDEPCPNTIKRLAGLKREQYELAQKL